MAKAKQADLSEFFKYSEPKRKPCKVGFVAEQLSAEEREQLATACAQDKGIINTGAIRQWLAARGHEVSVPAVTNHRNGSCTCSDE